MYTALMLTFVTIFAVVVTTTDARCSMVNEQWGRQVLPTRLLKEIQNSSPEKCKQSCIDHMAPYVCRAMSWDISTGICALSHVKKGIASPPGSMFAELECDDSCYMKVGEEGRHGRSGSKLLTLKNKDPKKCKEECFERDACAASEWQQGNTCHLFNTSESRSYPMHFKSYFSEKRCNIISS